MIAIKDIARSMLQKCAQARACTTKSENLCGPRRIVGQAILPAAGFRARSALDVQSRPAGWKAGCSQDWLPHFAAMPHCATWVPTCPTLFTVRSTLEFMQLSDIFLGLGEPKV